MALHRHELPLGNTEYATTINKIKTANPDAVFQTINGDSNAAS